VGQRLTVVGRGEGEALSIGAMTHVAAREEWLAGAYCVLDQRIEPGQLTPVHAHDFEDQAFWVLEGSITVWVDGDEATASPGGFVLRPKGLPHSVWNASDTPSRFLELTSPATRFQGYMRALSDLIDSGESSPERVAVMAADNGITFFPDLTEQLVRRTGLSTEGGFWKARAER
jgi:mannose-6-phosphate isomerase-like protein (cupin superfamily)